MRQGWICENLKSFPHGFLKSRAVRSSKSSHAWLFHVVGSPPQGLSVRPKDKDIATNKISC